MPKGCAWGLFDRDGKKDIYGTLNVLTPEVIRGAISEAKDGIHVSLKYAIYVSFRLSMFHWVVNLTILLAPVGQLVPSKLLDSVERV